MGSGTTALASLKSERKFVGYEIKEEYVKLSYDRLNLEMNKLNLDL